MLGGLFDALGVDAQLRGPFLQGLLTFTGVLITGWIAIGTWWANARKEAAGRRSDREGKRRDFQRALWSEIRLVWVHLYELGSLDARIGEATRRFEADPEYVPFVSTSMSVILADRLVKDVDLLEEAEIESIVEFYRQIRLIEQFAKELRSPEYRAFGTGLRRDMLIQLMTMDDRARIAAEKSLRIRESTLSILPARSALQQRLDERRLSSRSADPILPAAAGARGNPDRGASPPGPGSPPNGSSRDEPTAASPRPDARSTQGAGTD